MKRLAVRYGVPVSLFTDPPTTDDERLAQAIAESRRGDPHTGNGHNVPSPERVRR